MKYRINTYGWHRSGTDHHTWRQADLADSIPEAMVMMAAILGKFLRAVEAARTEPTDKAGEIGFDLWAITDNGLSPVVEEAAKLW